MKTKMADLVFGSPGADCMKSGMAKGAILVLIKVTSSAWVEVKQGEVGGA